VYTPLLLLVFPGSSIRDKAVKEAHKCWQKDILFFSSELNILHFQVWVDRIRRVALMFDRAVSQVKLNGMIVTCFAAKKNWDRMSNFVSNIG